MSRRLVPSKAKSSETARQSLPPPQQQQQQQKQQQQRPRQKPTKSRNATESFDTESVVEEELPDDAALLQKLRQNMRGHDEVESTFADAIDAIEEK